MNQIMAYFIYNIKMLSKDKLPIFWSVILPSVFLILNKDNISGEQDLRFWWGYIIITSYIFGIGLYALTLKESGVLKTSFSISDKPMFFFLGNLLTQIIFSGVCMLLFNGFVVFLYRFSVWKLLVYSVQMMVMLIPVAFFGFCITLIRKVHVNSLSTFANIVFMVLFYSLGIPTDFYKINPLYYFSNVIMINNPRDFVLYAGISLAMVLAGSYSIFKFTPLPIERR